MIDLQQVEGEARRAYESGADLESIVQQLRAQGCNIIACIKVVRAITGWELHRAKAFVHTSEAWSDKRAEYDELHELLFQALEQEGVVIEQEG